MDKTMDIRDVDQLAPYAAALLQYVGRADRVLLTGPIGPDGDSIGACLALSTGLASVSDTPVVIAGDLLPRYAGLPGAEAIVADAKIEPNFDLVLILDGDSARLEPKIERAWKAAKVRGIIDHHGSTVPDGYDLAILDGKVASTCQMVHAILELWDVPLTASLAEQLYTGLIFDTGGFRHANTDPEVHRLAARLLTTGFEHSELSIRVLSERTPAALLLIARVIQGAWFSHEGRVHSGIVRVKDLQDLGAVPGDIEGIVETLLNTTGVEISVLFVERSSERVKLSFRCRSRCEHNVATVASELSPHGGGHPRAAGALMAMNLGEAVRCVEQVLNARL